MSEDLDVHEEVEESPLDLLVGEGKKFRTIEDLAKGKLEADRFIEQLKSELDELRKKSEEAEKMSLTMEELFAKLESERNSGGDESTPSTGETHQTEEGNRAEPDVGTKEALSALDPNALKAVVAEVLEEQRRKERIAQGLEKVVGEFAKTLEGDTPVNEALSKKLQEVGISESTFTAMAAENPDLALVALGLKKEEAKSDNRVAPPSPSVNSAALMSGKDDKPKFTPESIDLGLARQVDVPMPKSYWQALKKANPTEYRLRSFEMTEHAKLLGENFWDV